MKARRKLQAEVEAQGWVRLLVVGGSLLTGLCLTP
jgi:hypothetical protein